MSNTIKEF